MEALNSLTQLPDEFGEDWKITDGHSSKVWVVLWDRCHQSIAHRESITWALLFQPLSTLEGLSTYPCSGKYWAVFQRGSLVRGFDVKALLQLIIATLQNHTMTCLLYKGISSNIFLQCLHIGLGLHCAGV